MKSISIGLIAAFALLTVNANAGELTLKTTEKYYAVLNLKGTMVHMMEMAGNQLMNNMQAYYSQDMKRRGFSDGEIKTALNIIRINVMDVRNVMLANLDQLLPVKQIIGEIYYPVLKKHFSEEEILELIRFYETPLGKKTITEVPAIASESIKLLNQSPYVPRIRSFISSEMDQRKDVIKKEVEKEIEKSRAKDKESKKNAASK